MKNLPPDLEYCDDLARYIERASCAVSVLGELLEAIPEEDFPDSSANQSLGFLLQILGDGMMQRSMEGYNYISRQQGPITTDNTGQQV